MSIFLGESQTYNSHGTEEWHAQLSGSYARTLIGSTLWVRDI